MLLKITDTFCREYRMSSEFQDLQRLQIECIALYHRLTTENTANKDYYAAPFLSCEPSGYFSTSGKKILFVGQATDRQYFFDEFHSASTVDGPNGYNSQLIERRSAPKKVFDAVETETRKSAFWTLAQKLSELGFRNADAKRSFMENLVWSNVAKIGAKRGNPTKKFLKPQIELSKETLRAEIAYYKPDIIYVAHSSFGEEIVNKDDKSVFGSDGWIKDHDDIWYRREGKNGPIIFASDHPGRKRKLLPSKWLSVVEERIKN